jgi:hypothetical protein
MSPPRQAPGAADTVCCPRHHCSNSDSPATKPPPPAHPRNALRPTPQMLGRANNSNNHQAMLCRTHTVLGGTPPPVRFTAGPVVWLGTGPSAPPISRTRCQAAQRLPLTINAHNNARGVATMCLPPLRPQPARQQHCHLPLPACRQRAGKYGSHPHNCANASTRPNPCQPPCVKRAPIRARLS